MDAELTNRSRDALAAAGNRAVTEGHPDLTPAHLLLALLAGQENENITDLLAAVDADQAAVRAGAERVLAGLPSVTGSTAVESTMTSVPCSAHRRRTAARSPRAAAPVRCT